MMFNTLAGLLFAAVLFPAALHAQSYAVSSGALVTYPILSNGNTLTLADDDLSPVIAPAGLSFFYFGAWYNSFQVGSNGYIVLGGAGTTTSSSPDHAAAPGLVIAPLWVNLRAPFGTNSWIRWRLDQGVLQVEWNNMAQVGGPVASVPPPSCDMVISLDTTTGIIEFDYGFPGASNAGPVSALSYAAAISGPSGTGQEVIPAYDPGYINADGAVSAWPQYRWVRFTPAGAQNADPAIALMANGSPVTAGSTLNVSLGSSMAALGLAIMLNDADADMVTVSGAVGNVGGTGIDEGEFNSVAAATPYALNPASGIFNIAGATHSVSLAAGDGRGGLAGFSFSILVGGAPANGSPLISVTAGGNSIGDGETLNVYNGQSLASLALLITVTDPEGNAATLTGTVGNVSLEGISDGEFSSPSAAVPYTVAPVSGRFDRASVSLPVALTAADGISPAAGFSFVLRVGPVLIGGAGLGGGGGGGGCVAGSGPGPLALLLILLAGLQLCRDAAISPSRKAERQGRARNPNPFNCSNRLVHSRHVPVAQLDRAAVS